MIGHLGTRVSALLDGQLPPRDAEQAWAHVYACHACRDLVEREGWIKTRLAGLGDRDSAPAGVPENLMGSLLSVTPGESYLAYRRRRISGRRAAGAAVVGGGAIGAAMVGVVAFGITAPASTPSPERQTPDSRITAPVSPASQQRVTREAATETPALPRWMRELAR